MQTETSHLTPSLNHLAVIRASGQDAASFFQGQLSNDFVLLPAHQWQLAAYCSPKGRMLASFWGIKLDASPEHQDIALVVSKDIATATLKRLSMFVMRAKVKLVDASQMLPELYANHGLAAWSEREIQRGVARITAPLVDLFVPQMLNFESIGGVSFKKGCYPGQEVVARSQFRGAIKRRTYLAYLQDARPWVADGADIFIAGESESCGTVVNAEPTADARTELLICIPTALATSQLQIRTPHFRELTIAALPYKLLEDI
jgi:folate-binding protein YgfZ